MANSASGSNWYIDTLPFNYPYRMKVENLNIENAVAGTTVVAIFDNNGKLLVNYAPASGDTAEAIYRYGKLGWINGINISTSTTPASNLDGASITINVGAGR